MRTEKLLDAIGDIDDALIMEAAPKKQPKSRRRPWIAVSSTAAVLALCLFGVWSMNRISNSSKAYDTVASESAAAPEDTKEKLENITNDPMESWEEETSADDSHSYDLSYTIVIDDAYYYDMISFEQKKTYELVPETADGLTEENTYKITEQDLGTAIGTVTDCANEEWIGAVLYHFSKYPEDNSIGILVYEDSYTFYVMQTFH